MRSEKEHDCLIKPAFVNTSIILVVSFFLSHPANAVSVNPGDSIQDAIEGLPPEGGIIDLVAGDHTKSSTINIINRNNITINGTGATREDTMIKYDGYFPTFDTFYIQDSNNITIKNLYIFSTAPGSRSGRAIVLNHTDRITISNIRIENLGSSIRPVVGGYGYRPENERNTNVVIENNLFTKLRVGLMIQGFHNSTVRNNEIGNISSWMGIDFNTGNADNIIENNTVYGAANSGIKIYSSNNNTIIRNNTVFGNRNYGILLLQGAHNSTIIGNTVYGNKWSGIGVTSYNTLSPSKYSIIKNNKVYDNGNSGIYIGIYEVGQTDFGGGGESYVESNTIVSNGNDGIHLDYPGFTVSVKNNIISSNSYYGITKLQSEFYSTHNDVWNNSLGNYNPGASSGTGDISVDPLFADAANADFHLKSQAGRWTDAGWVLDNETSPAIDAGDPADEFSQEPEPNGSRINLGAYGNTDQASKTPEGPDFGVSCSPATLTVAPGGTGRATCNVSSILGLAGTVTMSCSGLAAGVVCEFDSKTVALPAGGSGESALTLLVDGGAVAGKYSFQAAGTAVGKTRLFPMTLVVERDEEGGGDGGDGWDGLDAGPDDLGPDGKDGAGGGEDDAPGSDLGVPITGAAGCGCGGALGAWGLGAVMIWLLLVVRRRLGDRP